MTIEERKNILTKLIADIYLLIETSEHLEIVDELRKSVKILEGVKELEG
jgi:hypothetical protein